MPPTLLWSKIAAATQVGRNDPSRLHWWSRSGVDHSRGYRLDVTDHGRSPITGDLEEAQF
jgi:hypothetical protein